MSLLIDSDCRGGKHHFSSGQTVVVEDARFRESFRIEAAS